MTKRRYDELSARGRRWLLVRSLLRSFLVVIVLFTAYYLAPLDKPLTALTGLIAGLLLLAGVLALQIRAILWSETPRLRSIQALTVALTLLLLLFASTHYLIAGGQPGSYSEPLSRTDALYFTITVFATVGFGDIVPITELARVITMIQMIVGLITVGIVAKVILGAVQIAMTRRTQPAADSTEDLRPEERRDTRAG